MVTFDAVGTGGKQQLYAAVEMLRSKGCTVTRQEEVTSRGIYMLTATSESLENAQAAVGAAQFSLVLFD
jgi:hypothetical protein